MIPRFMYRHVAMCKLLSALAMGLCKYNTNRGLDEIIGGRKVGIGYCTCAATLSPFHTYHPYLSPKERCGGYNLNNWLDR